MQNHALVVQTTYESDIAIHRSIEMAQSRRVETLA